LLASALGRQASVPVLHESELGGIGVSQVNVNQPGPSEPAPVSDGSGYGFIVGIIVAILVIVLVVWLLLFNNGGGTTNTTTDGTPLPSAVHLTYLG
jgi:hypothetical protein